MVNPVISMCATSATEVRVWRTTVVLQIVDKPGLETALRIIPKPFVDLTCAHVMTHDRCSVDSITL